MPRPAPERDAGESESDACRPFPRCSCRRSVEPQPAMQQAHRTVGVLLLDDEAQVDTRSALRNHFDADPDATEKREQMPRESDTSRRTLAHDRDHREVALHRHPTDAFE